MTFEQIMSIVIAAAPSITALIGCIITFIKNKTNCDSVVDKFEELREEVFDTKQYDELKEQLVLVHKENLALKSKMKELINKIDKIQRINNEE